ncbi:hypothetical protein K504DRAFT_438370 [Pleomassaria siparia CBS 279.74]|uniref:Calponin-homology (CH) domain-containing protein n=1 Tax=Pleomassaria siparia CBS 279.74 TaxID=1314801 RepID=A0A6G1K1I6_9PLEO|nr:hypothetical protein K504DRAFT_438370 [Pleomassaria siparia CBS 279.74]
MASVTSLDQDMKKLRMGRYTPQAANEARSWIEDILGERLPPGDLLDALKDGTVLCRYALLPNPGVKFKKSHMPFIQMENISHFLRACEQPPLGMPSHDRFLTVDLFESKDPTQVLQCLGAFSRVANLVNPSNFPTTIGPKRGGGGPLSPTATGPGTYANGSSLASPGFGRSRGPSTNSTASASTTFNPLARPPPADRALSPALTGGSTSSRASNGMPKSPPGPVSSWSKKIDEGMTAPAWNIHQYGYMGGASQGNQGISFGARRQITSAGPHVPNMAEKERKRREKEAEEERVRVLAEEAEHKRRVEREAEEELARVEEERRWEEESRKQRQTEQRRLEKQKREWEDQERRWKLEEEQRQTEEREALEMIEQESRRKRAGSDARLKGQYLSQYQAEEASKPRSRRSSQHGGDRVAELERQLEEAKERERQYQLEREDRFKDDERRKASWANADDRDYLRQQRQESLRKPSRPLPEPAAPTLPVRPLPEPSVSTRPLPDPAAYSKTSRTNHFLASIPAPVASKPASYAPPQPTSTSERAGEEARHVTPQTKLQPGGKASKLLEKEMERERERQREWEETQRALQNAPRDPNAGPGEGQSWDVNQYGYTGGDSQNKVGSGIGMGGRRQILGPRPFGPR